MRYKILTSYQNIGWVVHPFPSAFLKATYTNKDTIKTNAYCIYLLSNLNLYTR